MTSEKHMHADSDKGSTPGPTARRAHGCQDIECRFATHTIHSLAVSVSRSSQRDRLDEKDKRLPANMAETSNDDDVKSNKRSHADFTGDDGPGMLPRHASLFLPWFLFILTPP